MKMHIRADILYPLYFAELCKMLPKWAPFIFKSIARKNRDNDLGWKCFGEPAFNLYAAATYKKRAIMAGILAPAPAVQRYHMIRSASQNDVDRLLFDKIGEKPFWGLPPGGKVEEQVIFLRYHVDVGDKSDWPTQHEWLRDRLVALYDVFTGLI